MAGLRFKIDADLQVANQLLEKLKGIKAQLSGLNEVVDKKAHFRQRHFRGFVDTCKRCSLCSLCRGQEFRCTDRRVPTSRKQD